MNAHSKMICGIEFYITMEMLKTDTLEIDFARRQIFLVNSAGKVKSATSFKLVETRSGESLTTGPG